MKERTEELRRIIKQILVADPIDDGHVLAQKIAQIILCSVLGNDWFRRFIASNDAPSDFFRPGRDNDRRIVIGTLRTIFLSEMIFNLQYHDGVRNSIEKIGIGEIEAGYAELEVGKILKQHGVSFKFITPVGLARRDYDLELEVGGHVVCADTKCKLETTKMGESSLRSSLKAARKQLPDNRPGMIFVKIPEEWYDPQNELNLGEFLRLVSIRFWRDTKRIVSVKYHCSTVLEDGRLAAPMIFLAEFSNPDHRFSTNVEWNILREMTEGSENWVSILKECDLIIEEMLSP